ncbi:aspartate carbamoyltransferase [Alicyclobacillus macrosporangiidus]|uniref:aspartate carbamoyltransferase n=1 Tax=Alicyclobacillus macrosporangiidus TaxID=392015 RepID=UPI000AED6002|nr:aspartate carbamoyltransferase [Alicyclobacillus macrosporangiidus]
MLTRVNEHPRQAAVRHLVTTDGMTRADVLRFIHLAEYLRGLPRERLRQRLPGRVIATLFYEPSTRTRLSFESAALKLGANVVGAENAIENSSAKKGETLADVFRIVGAYADAIVVRHHEPYTMAEAARLSPVPIINAGAGWGEHPTQALLDVYTISRELGRVEGLHVAVMGDLKYGRTVHSLLNLLRLFPGVRVTLLHPASLGLPEPLAHRLRSEGLEMAEATDVAAVLPKVDVVYQTRVQRERLERPEELEGAGQFRIGPRELGLLPEHARILHPLPRVDELDAAVDEDPRAAYFRQAENGLYMRMAILDDLLGGNAV